MIACQDTPAGQYPDLLLYMAGLAGLAVVPFLLMMVTSFAKFVVVGGLLRQALGLQQVPPTTVLTGLAMVMTFTVMEPVVRTSIREATTAEGTIDFARLGPAAVRTLGTFLRANTDEKVREQVLARRATRGEQELQPTPTPPTTNEPPLVTAVVELLTVDAPGFLLTELAEAFLIGFLLYVPFVLIDLIVANVLLAMGMSMLTPTTVSIPIKLMVFALANGWPLLFESLLNYRMG
jgi:type III secretion protein R